MLTPLDTNALRDWKASVDPDLQTVIDLVMATGNRSIYAFYETYHPSIVFMYRTVPPGSVHEAATLSVMGVALDIAIDDVADQVIDRDQSQEVIDSVRAYMTGDTRRRVSLRNVYRHKADAFKQIWSIYHQRMQQTPLFNRFADLWLHEWLTLIDSMQYSLGINTDPEMPYNFDEALAMLAPNMHLVVKHVVDMCFSPNWQDVHTPFALNLAREAEKIMRISNWIRSWRQEFRQAASKPVQRDITSGVFAMAVSQGIVTQEELFMGDIERIVGRIEAAGIEEELRSYATAALEALPFMVLDFVRDQGISGQDLFIDLDVYCGALSTMIANPHEGGNQSR